MILTVHVVQSCMLVSHLETPLMLTRLRGTNLTATVSPVTLSTALTTLPCPPLHSSTGPMIRAAVLAGPQTKVLWVPPGTKTGYDT